MKPDNSMRICVDYRSVNLGSLSDPYPMKRADDLLRKMAPAHFITTLDCTSGYYQIAMHPESVPLISFITHRGQFEFLYMSFGLKTAGSTFQRMIDELLDRHQNYALGYIDDVSVFSEGWSLHLEHLEKVLSECHEWGLTLKLKKCFFARPKVQFLGHIVGGGDISVVPEKIEVIRLMPEPSTKNLFRSFRGMCGYYR